MPLGFQSINQGVIAFGFFNIDTDLLLLEHYFFFADQFCDHIGRLADHEPGRPVESLWDVYHIEGDDVGDLMGAVHGIHYSGFIGEIYRRFPFPKTREGFRQKPEGSQNRSVVEAVLAGYASKTPISFKVDPAHETIRIGEYLFSRDAFQELVRYVWVGGYPRWKGGAPPSYVLAMKDKITGAPGRLFGGLNLPGERPQGL